jgi:hypothetical protein
LLRVAERYLCGRPHLLRVLADIESSGSCRETLYLSPERSRTDAVPKIAQDVVKLVGESETGVVIFVEDSRLTVIAPPFPLREDSQADGADSKGIRDLLAAELKIGVVLVRLGRYAVGVLESEKLVASKTDTRYVKNRHRAGGSSQRRFERSRERLIRELFDKACEVTQDILSPHADTLDHVLLGGEKMTVVRFLERCGYLKGLEGKTLARRLLIDLPNHRTLEGIGREVWKSRIAVLESDP